MTSTLGAVAICCAALLPVASRADSLRHSAEVGASLTSFEYTEFADAGNVLDRETGFLPGLALRFAQAGRDCTISQDLSFSANDLAHDGHTNLGTPFSTRTDETIGDASVQVGCSLPSLPRYSAYGGFGYTRWKRDIRGVARIAGLGETYSWWYALLGGRAVLMQSGASQLALDVRLIRTISPQLKVDFNGLFDTTKLALGERTGGRLSLPWCLALSQSGSLAVEPFYERLKLGRSQTQPLTRTAAVVGQVFEPNGERIQWGVNMSWMQAF